MIIRDRDGLKTKFYDVIRHEHVLIIVGDDVDALCASMILTRLLSADDVSFSLSAVGNWEQLGRLLRDHSEQSPAVVLINCGGTRPIDEMQVPESSKVYIIDSRRPMNLLNLYSNEELYVLVDSEEEKTLAIPSKEEMIAEESEDEDSSDEDESREERMHRFEKRQLKRELKRKWEKRRQDLEWAYYENTWHGMASAVYMLELASSLNRASAEFLWLAAIGLNSQWVERLISTQAYTMFCLERMRPFLNKFKPEGGPRADDVLRIKMENELPLAMYSKWNLYNAMRFDEHFACKTRNWTQRGDQNMRNLLCNLGLTLQEVNQTFEAMENSRRKEVFEILHKEMSSTFASFYAHLCYASRISAADLSRALAVKLASPPHAPLSDRFTAANAVVHAFLEVNGDFRPLDAACEKYKLSLEVIWQHVAAVINQSEVMPSGPVYLHVSSKELDNNILESRHFLKVFTRFLAHAFSVAGRKRHGRKPMIVAFPLGGERKGWHLVTGHMPVDTIYDDDKNMSYIGRAFREVSKRTQMQSSVSMDFFDTDIILVRSLDRARFFTLMEAVMEVN